MPPTIGKGAISVAFLRLSVCLSVFTRTRSRNIWNPISFNCLSPACRACDYVYIDYVRRSRSSSCRLLRPIICQTYITLHYIANNSRTQRPSVPKFGRKVPHLRCDLHTSFKVKGQGWRRSCLTRRSHCLLDDSLKNHSILYQTCFIGWTDRAGFGREATLRWPLYDNGGSGLPENKGISPVPDCGLCRPRHRYC